MSQITVHEVQSKADRRAFLSLPDRLHGEHPSYVPPLRPWLTRRLRSARGAEGGTQLRAFLARSEGRVVGRITALLDPTHNRHRDEAVCWFGFLEFEADPQIARHLLARVEDQAREWGCDRLRGQRNITRMEDPGIAVEGHDRPTPMLAAYHPPYYARTLEDLGFVKHHDLLAYEFELRGPDGVPAPLPEVLQRKSRELDLPGVEVRAVQWRRVMADLRLIYTMFEGSYKDVPGTAPLTWEQFSGLSLAFLAVASRHLVHVATVNGQPAGFVVCLPEVAEALPALRGRLSPLSVLRYLRAARRIRTASIKLIGVMPEFRGSGLHARILEHTVEGIRRAGYERVDGSLIDESNGPMRAVVEGAGMSIYRRYRFYERPVGAKE